MTGHIALPSEFGRTFNTARQSQGFRSQAHLDAFYAHRDHVQACAECQSPGPSMWLDGSASWQPTNRQCPEGMRLDRASMAYL